MAVSNDGIHSIARICQRVLIASFEGSGFDGDDIQQLALKHDLVRVEIFDPEVHVTMQSCEILDKAMKSTYLMMLSSRKVSLIWRSRNQTKKHHYLGHQELI
jgi:hypothetical protein